MTKHAVQSKFHSWGQCLWVELIIVQFERHVNMRVTWLPVPLSKPTQMSARSPFLTDYVIWDKFHSCFKHLFLTCKMSPLIRPIKAVECCCFYLFCFQTENYKIFNLNYVHTYPEFQLLIFSIICYLCSEPVSLLPIPTFLCPSVSLTGVCVHIHEFMCAICTVEVRGGHQIP